MADVKNHRPQFIDYRKISEALDYYESRGYEYMEVPWVIDHKSTEITLPAGREATALQYGDLVGSAEQSFIELMRRGETILKACAVTPCFRIEDSYDDLHYPYFLKCELIDTDATDENLHQMIDDASAFFSQYTEVDIEETEPDAYDIVDRKMRIELGSYGIRNCEGKRFIYGTGVALPRLTSVLERNRDNIQVNT